MKQFILIIFMFCFINCSSDSTEEIVDNLPSDASIYYPPKNTDEWQTTSISNLQWNENALTPLLNFLEEKNTKSFMILYQGNIVIEEYFNNHSATSPWYWASAGKTLTSTISGIAQDENLIDINASVSNYLGEGWTSLPLDKEKLITNKHLLSMNSGIDDSFGDDVDSQNLFFKANAGDRWAYHNVYVKIQDVISRASNQSFIDYFNNKLKDKIGMTGLWRKSGNLNVFWSNTRSMARFALLISANGKWENEQIVSESYLNTAINTSQPLNKAYGYLWWLNGKTSYKLPQSQLTFSGKLIPNAPNDMFCALGKNDQKIYILPSKNMVVIRMGESANDSNFALSNFDNELWEKINALVN